MTAALLAGVVAGFAVALPVGAVATYLVGLAARRPWRVGAAGALGIATVNGVYALLAALGGAALTAAVTPVAGGRSARSPRPRRGSSCSRAQGRPSGACSAARAGGSARRWPRPR